MEIVNRKAKHDYFIEETIEAGLALVGTEVKSIRLGKCNLKDSYADIENGEVLIKQMHISPYDQGNIFNVDPLRNRKLLLHKSEINRLIGKVNEKGYTLVPLKIYFKDSLIKVEIGLCKGKHTYDKKQVIKDRDLERNAKREIKNYV